MRNDIVHDKITKDTGGSSCGLF